MDKVLLAKDYKFNRVYESLNISAKLKSRPEDFIVEEIIDIDFSGDGEHCWINIEKQGCNTDWVAQELATFCKVKQLAVSYAGMKDRNAVTTQWFSVQLPGKPTPDWNDFEAMFSKNASDEAGEQIEHSQEKVRVLQSFRHNRKLQRGALKGNRFSITLRELSDTSDDAFNSLLQRCEKIALNGVPNYFGEQRFGRGFNNLDQAERFFLAPRRRLSKHKRGLYLSAARSWIFNHILSERINQERWDKRIDGDVFMLNGKSACFKDSDDTDENINSRLSNNEIHTTAPMWGDGDDLIGGEAAVLEKSIIDQLPVFRDGLLAARLKSQRRACRVMPAEMSCKRVEKDFHITFSLPAGAFATMVLVEIFSSLR